MQINQRDFKSNVWEREENACKHRRDNGWLSKVKEENVQRGFLIPVEMVQRTCKGMSHWKVAKLDGVQKYWIKGFTALHERVAHQLNGIVQTKKVSFWLTERRIVSRSKDLAKGSEPSHFNCITCLPFM